MKLPQIRITQTHAQIGLRIEKPKQQIEQPKAKLEIKQEAAQLEIKKTPAKLTIDQTRAWEEANLKGISTLANDWAAESRRQLMDGIARRATEGRQLAAIERGGNPIAELAEKNGASSRKDLNIAFIPSYGSVKFDYKPSILDINWRQGGAQIQAEARKPIHEYAPGSVEVYMRQRESLTIDFTGLELDLIF